MAVSLGTELGRIIGDGLRRSEVYKQDFFESEIFGNIQFVSLESASLRTSLFVYRQELGNHFTLDHPVNGELDSSVFELDTGLGSKVLFSSSEVQS